MPEQKKSYFRTTEVAPVLTSDLRGELQFITIKSAALAGRGDITLYTPAEVSDEVSSDISTQPLPVILLLHGVYGSHWSWAMKGLAHITLQSMIDAGEIPPMILAMPSDGLWGDGSGYLAHSGRDFEQWIVNDVPRAISEVTGNSLDAPHFISGLSMGGYGAMRLGAKYPDRFRAFSGHSSITDMDQMKLFVEENMSKYHSSDTKCLSVLETILENRSLIKPFRFDCGVDDLLIEQNRKLASDLDANGIDFIYEEFPGDHDWPYWTEHVRKTLHFFGSQC